MPDPASSGYVGQSVLRREDRRLLTGRGVFVADLALPGMLHAAIVRSPFAHARIVSVDMSAAAAIPGVVLTLTGEQLRQALPPVSDQQVSVPNLWRRAVKHSFKSPRQPILAVGTVRHVGEAVAVVVARDRYTAEDAAASVNVEYEPLPVVTDVEAALAPGAPLVHPDLGTNVISEYEIGKGDVEMAFRHAPMTLKRRLYHHRYTGVPMECRGVVADYDSRTDGLTIWASTQVVHSVRREVANLLGLAEARVRCVAPDVGGGFGIKGHVYPEDILLAYLARALGRPVKWIEERREHFTASIHSRDQLHDAEVAFDRDGRILAVRDRFTLDCGAWNPLGTVLAYNTAAHLLDYFAESKLVCTNKVPNAPYRGAGRPEAVFVMERLVDLIAHEVGLEPAEVRRRNMVRADEMPYQVGIPYRDGVSIVYDSGDFPRAFDRAVAAIGGIEEFRRRQREAREHGRALGLGFGCYTEGTGAGPFEGATVRIDGTGQIHVASGACPMGNGQETVYAQLAAQLWKVPLDCVTVSLGDTAAIPIGFGSIASRSTVLVSAAMHEASERVRRKAFAIAANRLECDDKDLELREGGVGVRGVPDRMLTLRELARAAGPQWDHGRPPGIEAGLEATYYYETPTVTWAYAVHAAIVDVDLETGDVRIDTYVIVHDAGVLVNPTLAEGQVVGGAVQGIGAALWEDLAYDENGQLLTTTLMDYAVPTAAQLPAFVVEHQQIPSPMNPFGVKGLGEGGAIAPPVAISNAVADALGPRHVEFNRTPVRREQIVQALREARAAAAR
ncbi:MAG: xanthine dehydrogenase [Candidatus Rokuibacteriota bacterium]|nr:MAG: xanthine dehydrogenase [Candidatus Rokubacteria bacterium]